jgi:methionine-rich copper-binding protein CopC
MPGIRKVAYRINICLYSMRNIPMRKFQICAITLAASLLWSVPSWSHAKLQSSVPAANSQLAHAPPTLTLNFSEEAQLAVLKLTSLGTAVPVALDRGAKPSSAIVVSLPALKPGKYEVQWSAIASDDGHITKGSFSFTVLGS